VPGAALTLDMKRCSALVQEDGPGANPDLGIKWISGKFSEKWVL